MLCVVYKLESNTSLGNTVHGSELCHVFAVGNGLSYWL